MAKSAVFVRHPYNYDVDKASDETGLECKDPSLAIQSQAEDADINTIVKRFGLTGRLPDDFRAPTYGDFTGISDYRSCLEAVRTAGEAFASLPADIRAKFANDPAAFVDFCSDEKNKPEMEKMGLLKAKEEPIVSLADVVSAIKESSSVGSGAGAGAGGKPAEGAGKGPA